MSAAPSHKELVAALERIVDSLDQGHAAQMKAGKNYSGHFSDAHAIAREALQKIKSEAAK